MKKRNPTKAQLRRDNTRQRSEKLTSDELAEVATKISAHLKAIGAAEFVVTKRGSYGHTWPAEVNNRDEARR